MAAKLSADPRIVALDGRASSVGSSTVVIDALDEPAAGFYAAHGFVRLPESPRLVPPMWLVGRMFER
ncbi:MAG: hypothetical protein ACREXT_16600 [Gammaproteobacteria bacterium]